MLAGTLKHAAMDVIVQPSEVLPASEKTGSRSFLKKECQPQGQSVQV